MRLFGLRTLFARGGGTAVLERPEVVPETVPHVEQPHAAPAAPQVAWTQARVDLAEEIWGEGFLAPGGPAEILRIAAPMGLSAASSLLLLGAEAGGPARVLATELNAWVSCRERDATLAGLAAHRMQRAGKALAKRATVRTWTAPAPDFGRNAFHHALIIEQLADTDPEAVLRALAAAVKPGGHVVLVELVADSPLDTADREVAAWCRTERRSADLPTETAISRILANQGFDIRVIEDQSTRHMSQALQGWKRLVRAMQVERPAPAAAAVMVAEAERWTRRLRLMHAGRIRLARWHAIAPVVSNLT